jgi:hypothetical protein
MTVTTRVVQYASRASSSCGRCVAPVPVVPSCFGGGSRECGQIVALSNKSFKNI